MNMSKSGNRQILRFQRQLKRAMKIRIKIPMRLVRGKEILDLRMALKDEDARTRKYVIFGGKF